MKQLPAWRNEGSQMNKRIKDWNSEEGGKYRAPKQTNGWISKLKNVRDNGTANENKNVLPENAP